MSNIILCGVGGQGTVLATRLLSRAALGQGLSIKSAETIGMAQRGGSVISHVRIGERAPSPLVGRGRADLIVGFEPAETVRNLSFLREGGTVVTSDRAIVPANASMGGTPYDLDAILGYLRTSMGDRLHLIDADEAFSKLGSTRVLNVVLLGAAARTGSLGVGMDELRSAIASQLPEHMVELNLRALDHGASA